MTRGGLNTMSKLNMSLDELGHNNSTQNNYSRGQGRGRGRYRGRGTIGRGTIGRGPRIRGRGRSTGRGSAYSSSVQQNNYSSYFRGRTHRTPNYRQAPSRGVISRGRFNTGGRWNSVNNGRIQSPNRRKKLNIQTTGKVIVSYLGSHVTSDDVKEIFEKTGTITQAFVKFDKTGKSTGTAEVVYARKVDARKAQHDLDGAQVDGVPIRVNLSNQSPNVTRNYPSRGRASMRGNYAGRGNRPYSNFHQ